MGSFNKIIVVHPVEQSKSLENFLQTLWSRLPGDPAILTFLEPGLEVSQKKEPFSHISGSGRGFGGFGLITTKPKLDIGSSGGKCL